MTRFRPYGRTLPVFFMEGLRESIYQTIGRPSAIALSIFGFQRYTQIHQIEEKNAVEGWQKPLRDYFLKESEVNDLDYQYIAIWFDAYIRNVSKPQAERFASQVAEYWILGIHPLYEYEYNAYRKFNQVYSLKAHYLKRCNDFLKQYQPKTNKRQKLTIAVFYYLLNSFRQDARIGYTVELSDTGMTINLSECPFCLNQYEHCVFFVSLIRAFLDYVQGDERDGFPISLHINKQQSTRHKIVVDLLEPTLSSSEQVLSYSVVKQLGASKKVLPIEFTHILIDCIKCLYSSSQIVDAIKEVCKRNDSDWLRVQPQLGPLLAYFESNSPEIADLDYSYCQLLMQVLTVGKSQQEYLLEQQLIGALYANQGPLIYAFRNGRSLVSRYEDTKKMLPIAKELEKLKFYHSGAIHSLDFYVYIVEKFANESGIAMVVQKQTRSIQMEIMICPFCNNTDPNCQFWMGLLKGIKYYLCGGRYYSDFNLSIITQDPQNAHVLQIQSIR